MFKSEIDLSFGFDMNYSYCLGGLSSAFFRISHFIQEQQQQFLLNARLPIVTWCIIRRLLHRNYIQLFIF